MNWDALGAMAEALPRASQFGLISMLSYSKWGPGGSLASFRCWPVFRAPSLRKQKARRGTGAARSGLRALACGVSGV